MNEDALRKDHQLSRGVADHELQKLTDEMIHARPEQIAFWTARLTFFSNREAADATLIAAQEVNSALGETNARIKALADSGDNTGGQLAVWTKRLAWATFALALATFALVIVEWLKRG